MGSLPGTYNDLYCLEGEREVGGEGRLAFCLEFAKLEKCCQGHCVSSNLLARCRLPYWQVHTKRCCF